MTEVRAPQAPAPRLRPKRSVPFVPQLTPMDCGAACLSSVLAYHGKHVQMGPLRESLGSGVHGITARRILTTARSYGLRARGVHIEPKTLPQLPPGSILHWDLAHFVVFESFKK